MLKRFDARECVQLKKKFEDERKKLKWLVFFMIISWILFGLYVKIDVMGGLIVGVKLTSIVLCYCVKLTSVVLCFMINKWCYCVMY